MNEDTNQQLTRVGTYGIALKGNKILLVTQAKGPFKGRLDLPGGGLEFGESVEAALKREFIEEVGMQFYSATLIANWTHLHHIQDEKRNMDLYQIGLIYAIEGLISMEVSAKHTELFFDWYDYDILQEQDLAPLAYKAVKMLVEVFP